MSNFLEALAAIVGPAHVVTDARDLAPALTDWRGRYTGQALALVKPASTPEVAAVVAACAAADVAIVPQGGNTGLCAGATPLGPRAQIVLRLDRMNRIRGFSPLGDSVSVDAGCILADVRAAAAERGLLFPLGLGAEGSCRIGGNVSTNAGGTSALRYGVMRDLTLGLEVVLADGTICDWMSRLRKDVTGFDLVRLFIGAEGTLGIVTGAVLKLFPRPARRAVALAGAARLADALALLATARAQTGDRLSAFEVISRAQMRLIAAHAPQVAIPCAIDADWFVLLEVADASPLFDARTALESALAEALAAGAIADALVAASEAQADGLWRIRHAVPEVGRRHGHVVSHDSCVPIDALPAYVARIEARLPEIAPDATLAICGHAGDGNLHVLAILPHDAAADPGTREALAAAITAMIDAETTAVGGAISAEHGIGYANRARFARVVDPVELALMRGVKRLLDPRDLMNPGKLLPEVSS